jgi:hypothetical protein
MDMDNGHDGWCLLKDSWMFHRWYFHVYGRPTERGVFTHLFRQLRGRHDPEVIVAGIFRLTMRDGSSILVTARRGTMARLHTVLPPGWKIGDHVPWLRDPPKRRSVRHESAPRVEPPVLFSRPDLTAAPPVPKTKPQQRSEPKTLAPGAEKSELAAQLLEYRRRRWG